ncbi:hypothetical protein M885DRAFT_521485 [Pelagophyceae sp. CCMP2097]|nr:hypothetical protein M885DRAFT_521485 [Pelagophyceae sp. CCMP2097]
MAVGTATALRAANASAATALRYTGVTLALLGTTCVARLEGDDSTLTWKPVRAHRPASGAGPARPPPRSKRSLPELASGNFSDEGSACSSEEDEEDDLAAAAGSLRLVNVRSVVAAQHTVTIRYDAAPGTLSTLVLRGSCTQAVAAALNEAAQSKRGVARKACDRRAHRLVREVFYWWICSHPKCLD